MMRMLTRLRIMRMCVFMMVVSLEAMRIRIRIRLLPPHAMQSFAFSPDIHFCRRYSAAHYSRNFQPRTKIQRGDGVFQQLGGDTGVDQGTQKHVAAYAGKTLEVCDAHKTISIGDPRKKAGVSP